MRRHPGIRLAGLGYALIVALSACDSTDRTSTTTSSAPSTTRVGDLEAVVAHSKRADKSTQCEVIIPAGDVSAATGATATLDNSGPLTCSYGLTKADGTGVGALGVVLAWLSWRRPSGSATVTTVGGNTAVQQRNSPERCEFWVILDSGRPPDTKGAVLWVEANILTGADPCPVAKELVEKGFARLPDA